MIYLLVFGAVALAWGVYELIGDGPDSGVRTDDPSADGGPLEGSDRAKTKTGKPACPDDDTKPETGRTSHERMAQPVPGSG